MGGGWKEGKGGERTIGEDENLTLFIVFGWMVRMDEWLRAFLKKK